MGKVIFISILLLIVSVIGYVYWNYYNPYSEGFRQGTLQKIERRGNLFKTYEGELQQAGNGALYHFSVDDDAVADSLQHCLFKTVRLHYVQYRRNLPWRGDNYEMFNKSRSQDVVDQVSLVSDRSGQ